MTDTAPKLRRTGHFVWRELMTPDVEAATSFYGSLFGWTFADIDMGAQGTYRAIVSNHRRIGGFLEMKPGAPFPPYWGSFVSVADVASTIERAVAQGSRLVFGPVDSHRAGPFAVLLDPQGAAFIPFHAEDGDGPPRPAPAVGDFVGETLATTNPDAAAAFYSDLFKWKAQAVASGQITLSAGASRVANVGGLAPGIPPNWGTSVVVADLDRARDEAIRLGGMLLMPPTAVPGQGRVAVIADRVHAPLGLFEPTPGS